MRKFVVRFALGLALIGCAWGSGAEGVEAVDVEVGAVEAGEECGAVLESEVFTPAPRSVTHKYCQQWTGCGFFPPSNQQNTTYCNGKCPTVCEDPTWGGYYSASTGCCICEPDVPW